MKPESGYLDITMGSYIEDLIGDIEWHMKLTRLQDPYFKQLSVEKFTLETLLKEIAAQDDATPTEILRRFAQKAHESSMENSDPNCNYAFEVSRDATMSILDGLYFGYLEGQRCDGFE